MEKAEYETRLAEVIAAMRQIHDQDCNCRGARHPPQLTAAYAKEAFDAAIKANRKLKPGDECTPAEFWAVAALDATSDDATPEQNAMYAKTHVAKPGRHGSQ
jgi:hypothetical protein